MVKVPPIITGRPRKYAFQTVTRAQPLVIMVDTEKEKLNVQQAASRYESRYGTPLATRTEAVGGRIKVTVYRDEKRRKKA